MVIKITLTDNRLFFLKNRRNTISTNKIKLQVKQNRIVSSKGNFKPRGRNVLNISCHRDCIFFNNNVEFFNNNEDVIQNVKKIQC